MKVRGAKKDKMKKARTQEDIRQEQRTGSLPMARGKVQVFMEECPFIIPTLAKIFPNIVPFPIHSIYVSALTEEIILKAVTSESDRGEQISLLDSNGDEITTIQEVSPIIFKKFLFFGPPRWIWKFDPWLWPARTSRHCSSVLKVLKVLGTKANEVTYALSVDTRTMSVILYKRIKTIDLVNWVKEHERKCSESEAMDIEETRRQLREDLE